MRRLSIVVLCACAAAAPALADGGAAPGVVTGWAGVAQQSSPVRFVALPDGSRTLVEVVRKDGGRVDRFASIAGRYGVALTTWGNATGGLSPDGRTLVLQSVPKPAILQTRTRFAVLSTKTLRVRRTIALRGDFSFDAISPRGRTLFLIQHADRRQTTHYLVRALDLRTGRLVPGAIVDKAEPDMAGLPVARTARRDASWVYTLYWTGPGGHPFVHALDTVHRRAVCLDLRWRGNEDVLWKLHVELREAGRRLALTGPHGRTIETVDLAAEHATT